MAINYGRLSFESTGITTAEPRHITHKAYGTQCRRQIELSELHAVQPHKPEGGYNPTDSIYTSGIWEWFHALPKHILQHENDKKKVAQFKVVAMDRDIKRLKVRIEDLRYKLRTFQDEHMQLVEHVKTLQ
jgi:hypothetical protein